MKYTERGIKIAILDSGVKLSHPAIIGKQAELFRILKDGSISNCESDAEDTFGHGTAIYNIYRSKLPQAKISCYKIQEGYQAIDDNCLIATLENILNNQYYDIINISLGTTCLNSRLYDVCKQICTKGMIIVAAFDNNGAISYPAAYPFVIGVSNSDKCHNKNQLVYIHGNIINFGANGNYQRLAWVKPDYIMLEGNSFACAHVGVMVAEIIQQGISGYENILMTLRKKAIEELGDEKTKIENTKKLFPIQRAALVPFNKEMHSIIRYSDLLKFDIIDVYDYKYSPHIGVTPGHLLKIENLLFNRPIKNIDFVDWNSFDTLIIGHLDSYGRLTNQQSMLEELIEKALDHKKKVFCFDQILKYQDNKDVYYPYVNSKSLHDNSFGKLYSLNKPIVGIFGTSSRQGKYTLQLALRKQFLKRGLRLGQVGTEPSAELFGMDYSYPMGYNSSISLSGPESILHINSILADLCKNNVDVIMVGSQSNTVPYSYGNLSYYPLMQINFLMAVQPDVVILCVNPYDDDNYIKRTKETIENLAGAKVIALVVFPMKLRDGFGGIYSSKVPLTESECIEVTQKFQMRHGLRTFILSDSISMELGQMLIDYLSE